MEFLYRNSISIGLTTYQTNRLFLLGRKQNGALSTFERLFDRPMGLHCAKDRLFLATRFQIWRLDNILASGEEENGYDRLFVPRVGYTTGDLDIHDLGLDGSGRPVFVNTRYSCLATLSETHSFDPIWKPSFISGLLPEDRCHLNGLAMENGKPRYVTAVSCSDVTEGWRDQRDRGGVVIDVESNEIVCDSLSMPHSPRVHNGKVWLLNAGTGELGFVDLVKGIFEPVVFCPSYLRGFAFYGRFAIAAISQPRYNKVFSGLKLDDTLRKKETEAFCGLMVIDLEKGTTAHWLRFDGGLITELYDVQILTETRCPTLLGFKNSQIQNTITFQEETGVTHHTLNGLDGIAVNREEDKPRQDSNRMLVRLQMNCQELEQRFNDITFPPINRMLVVKQLREPLFCSMIVKNDRTVALTVMEKASDNSATVISLFVLEKYRGNGFGKILLHDIEKQAEGNNINTLLLKYRTSWKSSPMLENVLENLGWSKPQMHSQQYRANIELAHKAPWVWETDLPENMEIFPWHELTEQESAEIRQRNDYPPFLTPFQEEGHVSSDTSFGLRSHNKVVGWIVTHRTKQDTIQYTSLYVQPKRHLAACGLKLLAAAVRSQIEINVPICIFMINSGNTSGVNLTNRRIRPYLLSHSEVYYSQKQIAVP